MKKQNRSVPPQPMGYEDFKHWLRCFERDLKKAWKQKRSANAIQAELDDSPTDEMLDLDSAKGRLITAIVRICDDVEFYAPDDTPGN